MKPVGARLQSSVASCRPFTGAWIETCADHVSATVDAGRPFTGAWIETGVEQGKLFRPWSPLHGGVD